MSGKAGGLPAADMRARHLERVMESPLVVRCAFCKWKAKGKAGDLLARARAHREEEHGITRISSRRFDKNLARMRTPSLTAEDWQEIDAEVAKRRRLNGLEEVAA